MSEDASSSSSPSPAPEVRRLETTLLRELLWAPELERYLGIGHLDFSIVDQIEAVKVRLENGVKLLDQRLLATLLAGIKRQMWICALMGLAAGAGTSALVAATRYYPPLCIGVGVLCLIVAVFAMRRWIVLRRDLFVLKALHGRYKGRVEACESMEPLLELARQIEGEVRVVAAPRNC